MFLFNYILFSCSKYTIIFICNLFFAAYGLFFISLHFSDRLLCILNWWDIFRCCYYSPKRGSNFKQRLQRKKDVQTRCQQHFIVSFLLYVISNLLCLCEVLKVVIIIYGISVHAGNYTIPNNWCAILLVRRIADKRN